MTGGQGQGESATSPRRLTAAEKRDRAFALKKSGATYQEIGTELGCTRQMAHKMVVTALKELPPRPELEDFRSTELETCDVLQRSLWPRVLDGDPEACRAVLRVMERRTKLVGGDALPAMNALPSDVVQGVLDALIGMAVRLLAPDARGPFLVEVERQMLAIDAPKEA